MNKILVQPFGHGGGRNQEKVQKSEVENGRHHSTHKLGEHIRSVGYLDVQVDMVAPNIHYRYTYVKKENLLLFAGIG